MINKSQNIKIIISGGGTGGHIFPAISIANALKELNNNIEILFVGADNRMEMEKVPAAGYKIIGLPIVGFQRDSLFKNFSVAFKLLKSLFKARSIVKDFKPNAVIGVGGYASGPMLYMASLSGVPTFIQEQNSFAGITNKILAKRAKIIFVAYAKMERYFPREKIIIAGNPVRQGLENISDKKSEAVKYFGLEPDKPVILSIGGSLGARTLNHCIIEGLSELGKSNVQFIWQSGKTYFEDAKKQLDNSGFTNIKLFDFISRMDLAYVAADLVISRAGASSISELCIVSKPSILVPSPNVAEDHQTKNALALVNKNAAIMISDAEAPDKLISTALQLVKDVRKLNEIKTNIGQLALYNSAENIAREILRNI